MAKKPASPTIADPASDLADLVAGAVDAPGNNSASAEAGANPGTAAAVQISDLRIGDVAAGEFPDADIRPPAAPTLPEIVTHTDLPVAVDVRWLDGAPGLLVTVSLIPGFEFVGPAAVVAEPAVAASPADPDILDPEALLAWRELEDGSGIVIGVTRDGHKVRGRFA